MRYYLCYRATMPVAFDGDLESGPWASAPWSEDFVDIEGSSQPQPPLRTRVKMLWDDECFYVGAELEEPHVWATLTRHDSVIFQDPDFEVFIDPDWDNHEYYEWEVNAFGTTWDLMLIKPYRDGGPAVNAWEIAGCRHAVHIHGTLNDASDLDRGWTVEVGFPWEVLAQAAHRPCPPGDGDQWRINFSRVEWDVEIDPTSSPPYVKVPNRSERNWVWSPQGVVDMHRPEHWGIVQFCVGEPGSGAYVPDPSLAARQVLHEVYAAQRACREARGSWASRVEHLAIGCATTPLPFVTGEERLRLLSQVRLETTTALFEASLPVNYPDGSTRRWHIRQDSKVWSDAGPLMPVHRW